MAWLRDQPPLVRSFKQGDRPALTAVYRHYVDGIVQLARQGFTPKKRAAARVAGIDSPDSQLDFTQEVFVRAFAEPARLRYDGLRPYAGYLHSIARNYRIDQLRRSGRELPGEPPVPGEPLPAPDPVEQQHWDAQAGAAREYLDGLDEESIRFVQLRFEQEGSQAEVAERMGISRRRVRTLEGRVTRGLARHLARKGLGA